MSSALRSTHVNIDEDLFEVAHKEAEKQGITFADLYRRALKAELKYPSVVAEVRDLREDVNEIQDFLPRAARTTQDAVEENRELINGIIDILKKYVELER